MKNGFSTVAIILLVAAGLLGGGVIGYEFREPIRRAAVNVGSSLGIADTTTSNNTSSSIASTSAVQFEIEGTTAEVNVSSGTVVVNVKSSTDNVKELRLSQVPVLVTGSTGITFGDNKNLKLADIPLNSKIHIHGSLVSGIFAASKIEIQKEDSSTEAATDQSTEFEIQGTVQSVASDGVTLAVTAANKAVKNQIGATVTLKVTSVTSIEKNDSHIAVTGLVVGDKLKAEGKIISGFYTVSSIEVKVTEKADTISESTNQTEADKQAAEKAAEAAKKAAEAAAEAQSN